MGAFRTIFGKEIRAIGKEKTIVLAIVIQLIIASLSSVILIGLMSFYDPGTIGQNTNLHLKIGIVGDQGSELITDLQRAHITAIYYDDPDYAQQDFVKGDKVSVEQHVKQTAKAFGGTIVVKAFTRYEKGEGIEKKQENFADEIAKLVQ
jgi:ABC-type Na+ efflux pump permease subunit